MQTIEEYTFEPIKGYPMLNWKGKRPFSSTQFYPAQLKETYGEEQNNWINKIFWGDNLQVMSHLLKEYRGKIDLIYIDPPFDSKADYKKKINLKGKDITNDNNSFEEKQYTDIWSNDDYLQFMYERLILLRELLSDKGSIYVHCDWHKSHLIRCTLEEIFGNGGADGKSAGFKSEIIWQRTDPHNDAKTKYGNIHDVVFFFSKSQKYTYNWSDVTIPLSGSAIKEYSYMKLLNGDIQKQTTPLPNGARLLKLERSTQKGNNPNRQFEWRGVKLKPGIQWMGTLDEMEKMLLEKKIFLPNFPIGQQRCRVLFLDERQDEGQVIQDIWQDVGRMKGGTTYPTQKPEALLERIIKASTNPGDIVLDCFMGSGTTQAVSMKLGRKFIGADINLGAIETTTKRLNKIAEVIKVNAPKVEYTNEEGETKTVEEFYTGFSVYNVNNYDIFRNPVQAKELIIEALEIQPLPNNTIYDGEKDGRMVKIMDINRITTRADLNSLITGFNYKAFDKKQEDSPNKPVEHLLLVCMGHEPDLAAALQNEVPYKLDIEVVDILRDKSNLEFKRDSEASISIKNNKLIVEAFYPMNLLQKLSLQKENVEDWKELVESIKIDFNYDGSIFEPSLLDIPENNKIVLGEYDIPKDAGNIKVKITDLLSESLEMEVNNG